MARSARRTSSGCLPHCRPRARRSGAGLARARPRRAGSLCRALHRCIRPAASKGMRLGIYEHSSAARDLLHRILRALGARPWASVAAMPSFPSTPKPFARRTVPWAGPGRKQHGFDAILTTDGDADRPLIADESGEWLRGDVVGILCAQGARRADRGDAREQQHRTRGLRGIRRDDPHQDRVSPCDRGDGTCGQASRGGL